MNKREFLMLAHVRKSKDYINSWYMSTKLDGMRCFYDGGITQGVPCSQIPFANTLKHARYVTAPIATGLWSRLGQPIQAPNWWLEDLPKVPLDGELTAGTGSFQETMSIVKTSTFEHADWHKVKYMVFDSPALKMVLQDGVLNGTFFKKMFKGCVAWAEFRGGTDLLGTFQQPYYKIYAKLKDVLAERQYVERLEQCILPMSSVESNKIVESELLKIEALGGEGLMLRNPISIWEPERSHQLLKVKSMNDMEGTVIGYTWGKATDIERSISGERTDKMLGVMGSLRLRLDSGIEFDLSGFTDAERKMQSYGLDDVAVFQIGVQHAGERVSPEIYNPNFLMGARVSFKYRELSNEGLPKEARYWRKQSE